MNLRIIHTAKVILIALSVMLIIESCSCRSCYNNSDIQQVPDSIFVLTDKYIVSQTGEEFFDEYIHPDYQASSKKKDKYEVRYNFKMAEYYFVDEEVIIITDTTGSLIKDFPTVGIPQCARKPGGCNFIVDEKKAIEIAKQNSMPEGIKDWAVAFRWSGEMNKYVWHVLSTTKEFGNDDNYKAEGQEIMIDPLSGMILKYRGWQIL